MAKAKARTRLLPEGRGVTQNPNPNEAGVLMTRARVVAVPPLPEGRGGRWRYVATIAIPLRPRRKRRDRCQTTVASTDHGHLP